MGRKGGERIYQFVDDLVTTGASVLRDEGKLPDAVAQELSKQIAHRICFQYARAYMYVPLALDLELSKRDEEIWRAYTTDSPTARRYSSARVEEISVQFKLTEAHIYNIVRVMRARELDRLQGKLPGFDANTEGN